MHMTMDSCHKAVTKRGLVSLSLFRFLKLNKITEIKTAQNLFLSHWPLLGCLPGSTNQGYKTSSWLTALWSVFFPWGTQVKYSEGNAWTSPLLPLKAAVFSELEGSHCPLRCFTATEGNGNLSGVEASLFSVTPRASGKSGAMLLWNHRAWYRAEPVARLATECSQLSPKHDHQHLFLPYSHFWPLHKVDSSCC